MDPLRSERREMARALNAPGARPDPSLRITRRTFIHKSLVTAGVAAGATAYGWFPLINTVDLAFGQTAFKFAWISDTHLYPRDVNTRFVEKAGDLARLGDPVELDLGADILEEATIRKAFIPASTTGTSTWASSGTRLAVLVVLQRDLATEDRAAGRPGGPGGPLTRAGVSGRGRRAGNPRRG